MVLWGYPPLIYSQTAIERAIQKSTNVDLSSKLFQDDLNYKKISFLGLCLHTKRAHCWHPSMFIACLSSVLICRRTQLWHASSQSKNQILSNMQDPLLQIMQLLQYPHVSLFSTVITNELIGEDFYLIQHSMDGYEAMGFDVTQLT